MNFFSRGAFGKPQGAYRIHEGADTKSGGGVREGQLSHEATTLRDRSCLTSHRETGPQVQHFFFRINDRQCKLIG